MYMEISLSIILKVEFFKMLKIFVFVYFITTLSIIDTARILAIFPAPSVSHQVVFRVLTQELVKRGHEVVVIAPDPAFPKGQAPANLTEIDVHDLSYLFLREVLSEALIEYKVLQQMPWPVLEKLMRKFNQVLEVQVKSEPVQRLIREKKEFDILLIEGCVRPAIGFSHVFKAPIILMSSFGAMFENLETIGAPTHPILYPIPHRQRLYNLSLLDKLREYFYFAYFLYLQRNSEHFYNEILRRTFGPNVPPITELENNVDMLFLNINPIWMDNQPMPPGVVFMGGLHQKPIKELPQELKSYLDSSNNGVIYVSFGTNVHPSMFPPERLEVITEALSELPYDILFKWNDDELPGKTKNINISKWLPQSDLLRHPKVKAFVTQGGLQSTDEAITAGVPLVCIPMVGDQWYNAEKYERMGIGIQLDFLTITKLQLKNSIETVISNRSYHENIVKLRKRMYDQPQSPLERAVWWIEYVLRHGGARHLRAPAANMSWAEYYELELVLIVLTCVLISILIGIFVIISLCRCILRPKSNSSSNVKFKIS